MPAPNPYNSSGSDAENAADAETRRLRLAYAALPKTGHGQVTPIRHSDVQPEWVIQIIENPYDQWPENGPHGEERIALAGRIPGFSQWIRVVFVKGDGVNLLHTAFADHRLARKYGGRPWRDAP